MNGYDENLYPYIVADDYKQAYKFIQSGAQ